MNTTEKSAAEHVSASAASRSIVPVRIVHRPFGKMKKIVVLSVIVVAIVLIGALKWWHHSNDSSTYINSSDYQAVFLANNQVYFGKLQRTSDRDYRITDVYYLQSQAAASPPTTDPTKSAAPTDPSQSGGSQASPQLVKLGSELHGPDDQIVFNKDQVLFWENLKSDSKVTKAIQNYHNK